ncbi:MAG: DUF4350 domain-containing protein [Ilumatobacteraceae bacterium]
MSPRLVDRAGGRGTRVALTASVVVVVALVMLLVGRARPERDPFDPNSTRPDGARALVLLLRAQGAQVDISRSVPQPSGASRVVVLDDRLDEVQHSALTAWVAAGGIAVIADPSSSLHDGLSLGPTESIRGVVPATVAGQRDVNSEIDLLPGRCTIGALQRLRGLFVRDAVRFAVSSSDAQCFSDGHAFAFVRTSGSGYIVGLGDNHLFTNALIRYADNSGLATALLAPTSGTRVQILIGNGARRTSADIGTGTQTLTDLVRPGVWMALIQLGAAFLLFAIARAVRVGRPLDEPRPVPLAGSELVVATGNLMQRAGHVERAGWWLRGAAYREMCGAIGVQPFASVESLDALVASRGLAQPGEVTSALSREPRDPAGLLLLANDLAALRHRICEPDQQPVHQGATP